MKILSKAFCVVVASAFIFSAKAQYRITVLDSTTFQLGEGVVLSKTSFRGLSVVDDHVIWVSGSRGTVARSVNGGKSFEYKQLKGYEKSDFRDIEAFDDKRAILMSSGTPAYILKTVDGGQSWKEVYKNTDTAYFLDAMDFWDDNRGVVIGDPIHEHFIVLTTNDGGNSWKESDTSDTPHAFKGESIFAASGTSLRCLNKFDSQGSIVFVTGGDNVRLIEFNAFSEFVDVSRGLGNGNVKISKGAFSIAANNNGSKLVIVGGDYSIDTLVDNNSWIYNRFEDELYSYERIVHEDSGSRLKFFKNKLKNDVFGYRSGVEMIKRDQFLACGTSGVDLLKGEKWINISRQSFHVVRKAKKGKIVFLAGYRGKIGKLIY